MYDRYETAVEYRSGSTRPREGKKPDPMYLRADIERIIANERRSVPRTSPTRHDPITIRALIADLKRYDPEAYVSMEGCGDCVAFVAGSTSVDAGRRIFLYGTNGGHVHSAKKNSRN